MQSVDVNIVAVLLSTVTAMVIGYIWYHPKVFGTTWEKLGKVNLKKGSMPLIMGFMALSAFVMSYVLAHAIYIGHVFYNNSLMQDSLATAGLLWAGLQGLRIVMRGLFNRQPLKLSFINAGYELMAVMAAALIIAWVGVS